MNKKRIVITGIGILSPIAIGKDAYWEALKEGGSGVKEISLFDTSDLKIKVGGEIADFNPKEILGKKGLMDLDRATLLLLSATSLALNDSHLEINDNNTHRTGVSVGTTFGSLHSISKFNRESFAEGPRYVNPSIFPSTVGNSPASRVSIRFKIKGFNATISTNICAALDALDYARDCIELDRADIVIAGSVEDLSIQTFLGLYKLGYLAGLGENTDVMSCPFDRRHNGIVCAEGAAVLILQEGNSVRDPKTHIYGEVLGVGSCFDPVKLHKYNPKGDGMKEAMKSALKNAALSPQHIDCIFANANSTKEADRAEALAIKDVFGDYAQEISIVAIKSMLGETLSASGGIATIAALGALKEDTIPPTINYKEKDDRCDLKYVSNTSQKKKLSKIMINAFDPSGANTSLIIGKYETA